MQCRTVQCSEVQCYVVKRYTVQGGALSGCLNMPGPSCRLRGLATKALSHYNYISIHYMLHCSVILIPLSINPLQVTQHCFPLPLSFNTLRVTLQHYPITIILHSTTGYTASLFIRVNISYQRNWVIRTTDDKLWVGLFDIGLKSQNLQLRTEKYIVLCLQNISDFRLFF